MKIDNYILERLRADASHTIALAEREKAIQHPGLRGRLREILIGNLLVPWLPPFCKCVTGTIIGQKHVPRRSTQDDILVIDPSLAPPVLANPDLAEGVFHFNSVLLRIEVKSTLSRKGISSFIETSSDVAKMEYDTQPDCRTKFTKPYSILVAYKSNSRNDDWDHEFYRFCDVMKEEKNLPALSGFVSAICVIEKGFWFLKDFGNRKRSWCRLDSDVKEDRLVWLVAQASNTAYRAHVERQGRDPSQGLEVGIGSCIPPATIFQVPVS